MQVVEKCCSLLYKPTTMNVMCLKQTKGAQQHLYKLLQNDITFGLCCLANLLQQNISNFVFFWIKLRIPCSMKCNIVWFIHKRLNYRFTQFSGYVQTLLQQYSSGMKMPPCKERNRYDVRLLGQLFYSTSSFSPLFDSKNPLYALYRTHSFALFAYWRDLVWHKILTLAPLDTNAKKGYTAWRKLVF